MSTGSKEKYHVECLYGETIKEMREDVKNILSILLGNGKTGFIAKVNLLWGASVFIIGGVLLALIGHIF